MSQPVSDPGAEPTKVGASKLPSLVAFIRAHPDCTLRGGEGKLLLDELDRLTPQMFPDSLVAVWCCIYVENGESQIQFGPEHAIKAFYETLVVLQQLGDPQPVVLLQAMRGPAFLDKA